MRPAVRMVFLKSHFGTLKNVESRPEEPTSRLLHLTFSLQIRIIIFEFV